MIEMYNSDGYCLLSGQETEEKCYKIGCENCKLYKDYKKQEER